MKNAPFIITTRVCCILDLIRKVKSSHYLFEGCDDSSNLCICQITYHEIMIEELEVECLFGMFIWNVYLECYVIMLRCYLGIAPDQVSCSQFLLYGEYIILSSLKQQITQE